MIIFMQTVIKTQTQANLRGIKLKSEVIKNCIEKSERNNGCNRNKYRS